MLKAILIVVLYLGGAGVARAEDAGVTQAPEAAPVGEVTCNKARYQECFAEAQEKRDECYAGAEAEEAVDKCIIAYLDIKYACEAETGCEEGDLLPAFEPDPELDDSEFMNDETFEKETR